MIRQVILFGRSLIHTLSSGVHIRTKSFIVSDCSRIKNLLMSPEFAGQGNSPPMIIIDIIHMQFNLVDAKINIALSRN